MLQQLTPGYDKAARLKAALQRQKRSGLAVGDVATRVGASQKAGRMPFVPVGEPAPTRENSGDTVGRERPGEQAAKSRTLLN